GVDIAVRRPPRAQRLKLKAYGIGMSSKLSIEVAEVVARRAEEHARRRRVRAQYCQRLLVVGQRLLIATTSEQDVGCVVQTGRKLLRERIAAFGERGAQCAGTGQGPVDLTRLREPTDLALHVSDRLYGVQPLYA